MSNKCNKLQFFSYYAHSRVDTCSTGSLRERAICKVNKSTMTILEQCIVYISSVDYSAAVVTSVDACFSKAIFGYSE